MPSGADTRVADCAIKRLPAAGGCWPRWQLQHRRRPQHTWLLHPGVLGKPGTLSPADQRCRATFAGPASQQIAARLRDSGAAHAEKAAAECSPSPSDRSDSDAAGPSESEDEGQDGYRRGQALQFTFVYIYM